MKALVPGQPPNEALKLTRLSGRLLRAPDFGGVLSRASGIRLRRAARGNHPLSAVQLNAGVRRPSAGLSIGGHS